jgi:hypothetical protein
VKRLEDPRLERQDIRGGVPHGTTLPVATLVAVHVHMGNGLGRQLVVLVLVAAVGIVEAVGLVVAATAFVLIAPPPEDPLDAPDPISQQGTGQHTHGRTESEQEQAVGT